MKTQQRMSSTTVFTSRYAAAVRHRVWHPESTINSSASWPNRNYTFEQLRALSSFKDLWMRTREGKSDFYV